MYRRILLLKGSLASFALAVGNPYVEFYTPNDIDWELPPRSGNCRVIRSADGSAEAEQLLQDGYGVIGSSDFSSTVIPPEYEVLDLAEKVQAGVVLLIQRDKGPRHTVKAIATHEPPTVIAQFESGFFNGWRGLNDASGSYHGRSVVVVPGKSSTQLVPVTEDSYEIHAVFWRKGPPPIFGAQVAPLPSSLRAELQQNSGVLVTRIITDSPAFRANILQGDVLTSIDGRPIDSPDRLKAGLEQRAGQRVEIDLIRNNAAKRVSAVLNPAPTLAAEIKPIGAATEFRKGGRPWNGLAAGMTRKEVRAALGAPEQVVGEEGEQIWGYARGGEVRFHKHFLYAWSPPQQR